MMMSPIKEPLLIWILSNVHAVPSILNLVSCLTYRSSTLSGQDYSGLLSLVMDTMCALVNANKDSLKSNPVPLDALAVLANLTRDQDNRAIVKKYPSCSKLYKKLTTYLTDEVSSRK